MPYHEKYFYLQGADDSVLMLNPILKETGYTFVKFSAEEFEDRFHSVFRGFSIEKEKKRLRKFKVGEREWEYSMSDSFEKEIQNSDLIYFEEIYLRGYLMLLKDDNVFHDELDEEVQQEEHSNKGNVPIDPNLLISQLKEFGQYDFYNHNEFEELDDKINEKAEEDEASKSVKQLITRLRIFKSGTLRLVSSIFFDFLNDFEMHYTVNFNIPNHYSIWKESFRVEEQDLAFLSKHLSKPLVIPSLLELAFNSFNESYNILDQKLRFVVLMISLESIFNKSAQDPIQHILSRHVALTLSSDKTTFECYFKELKRLYNIRSTILHGKIKGDELKKVGNIKSHAVRLEEIVRSVLRWLVWLYDYENSEPTKESLFTYLNSKGFEG